MAGTRISDGTPISLTGTENVPIGNGAGKTITTINGIRTYVLGTTASGDLSGTYLSPTVSKILGNTVPSNGNGLLNNDGSGELTWVSAGSISAERLGAIYSETFSGTLGSYTLVGSPTAAISGGTLNVSGGTGTVLTKFLRRNYITSLEWNYRKVRFTSTVNSTAEGLGIGMVSRNAFSATTYGNSMMVTIDLSGGASRGTVYVKSTANGGSSFSTVATSTNKLSYTNGDVIELTYTIFNSSIQVIVKNVTTDTEMGVRFSGSIVFSVGTIFINAVCSPVISTIGGSQSISLDEFGTDYQKEPILAFFGDSVTYGFYSASLAQSWASEVTSRVVGRTIKIAASGSGLDDLYNSFTDLTLLSPKYVLVEEGLNEAINGTAIGDTTTPGTYAYKLNRVVNLCLDNNMIPIFVYSTPVGSAYPSSGTVQALIDSYNAFLTSQYSDRYLVIDIATSLKSGGFLAAAYDSGDHLHPSAVAQLIMCNDIVNNLRMIGTTVTAAAGLNTQIQFNDNGTLGATAKMTWDGNYFKIGTSTPFSVFSDYPGSGEIPACALLGSYSGSCAIFPDMGTATVGSKLILSYNSSGGVRSALEFAHTASSFGALAIMKSGGATTFGGDVKLGIVGSGFYIKGGTNACAGVATLVGGTVVVSTTKVTANSIILLTGQNLGTITVPAGYSVSTRSAGVSFTILSANVADTSIVGWEIVELT